MVSDGALSQTGTISVTVKNAVEGRVVDAPLSDSEVCIDLNADSQCQASETSVRSDAAGFYSLPAAGNVDGATRRVLSIGGTDIVTGKVMKSLAMVALMPIDPTKQVTVTPLSTVLSVSDDPQATMIALGLPAELTFEELSSFDPWILATENADAGSAAAAADLGLTQDALDQVVKDVISISTQIASLIETAETAVSDTTTAGVQSSEERAAMLTSSVVRAVSTAIAKESLANGGATKVSLASSTLVTEVLIETVESSAVTIVQAVETKQASGEIDGANLNAETFAAIIELKQASEVITQTGLDVAATSAVTAVANNTAKVNQQIDNLVQTTGGAALNDKNAADALVDLIETTNDLANQLVDGDISIETFVDAADVDEIASRAGGLVDLVKEVVENGANPDSGATDGSGTTDGPGITDGSGTTSGGTTDGSSDGSGTTSGGTTDGSSDGSGTTSGGTTDGSSDGSATTSGGTTDGSSDGSGTTSGGTTDGSSDGSGTTSGGTTDGSSDGSGTTSGGTTDGSSDGSGTTTGGTTDGSSDGSGTTSGGTTDGSSDGSGTTSGGTTDGSSDGSGTTSGGTTDGSSDGSGTTSGGTTDGASDGSGTTSGGTTDGSSDGSGTTSGGTTDGSSDGSGTTSGGMTDGSSDGSGTTSGGTTDGSSDGSGTTSGGTTDGSSDGSGTTSGGTTDGSSDGLWHDFRWHNRWFK